MIIYELIEEDVSLGLFKDRVTALGAQEDLEEDDRKNPDLEHMGHYHVREVEVIE